MLATKKTLEFKTFQKSSPFEWFVECQYMTLFFVSMYDIEGYSSIDSKSLSKYLRVVEESKVKFLVHVKIIFVSAPNSWQDDHSAFLSLEFFHTADFDSWTESSLFNHLLNLLHLTNKGIWDCFEKKSFTLCPMPRRKGKLHFCSRIGSVNFRNSMRKLSEWVLVS